MIEADTVAHCGPTLKGEFVRTLTMTDMHTGWTQCRSVRNNASVWILAAVSELVETFPFPVTGFDSDNGTEFINHDLARWLQDADIAFTRSRPYRKNDQATVESKNNHVVRKNAYYYRYARSRRAPSPQPTLGPGGFASELLHSHPQTHRIRLHQNR